MTVFKMPESGGVWFDLDNMGRIKMRQMSAEKYKEIQAATVKQNVEYKKVEGTIARLPFEETDTERQNDLFWDYVIEDFENIFIEGVDKEQEEVECTPENKKRLMAIPAFMDVVLKYFEQLTADEAAAREAEIKN